MRQYAQVKAKYPDTILLFRMGDFYETFEEDAKVTSKVLGIVLTRRGNGTSGETPLAGFPHHALESYLPKLLKAGHRVAICEQLEDPKFAKGIVKRDVIEVVTPGVSFSDKVLEQKQNNYLMALALPSPLATGNDIIGVAFVDVSTAEFRVSEIPLRQLQEQIASLSPSEIIAQKRDIETLQQLLKQKYTGIYSKLDDWIFNYDYAYELLINHFKTQTLKGFGVEGLRSGIIAAGAVMNYLQETQKTNLSHLRRISPYNISEYMILDPSTKRNLEMTKSVDGKDDGTLFWVLDRTQTPMGGRMLKEWLNHPLRTLEPIQARLEAVKELFEKRDMRRNVIESLSHIGDLERLISKICTGRANPREVVSLKNFLSHISKLKLILNSNQYSVVSNQKFHPPQAGKEIGNQQSDIQNPKSEIVSSTLQRLHDSISPLNEVVDLIEKGLQSDPPLALNDGGVIKQGYNGVLDELRDITLNGKQWIANLQAKERERTGISSLKIGFNNVFGYYIEVTHTHKEKIPNDYIRKQTMTNAERFITPELKEYEEKILHAEEKILALETQLFNELRLTIAEHADAIQHNARLIAMLDCFASLADVAYEYKYVCPDVNDSTSITIVEGRHPVIEQLLPPGEQYTPNDVLLDTVENQILIITGPNMSGKSSYLRQAALISLLAQIGSFVPAKEAHLGIVDRIFTRVGASDNIASGESTFLVEMHEAANIVNSATEKSLILLDEVGRGTSTFDGISIAWSLTEYLHNRIGAKTLFATHYHELNELADLHPRIKNYKVDVREYGDKVIFLHKVKPGFADHSYGIQVAQMAGLPEEVTERAKSILKNLEGSELTVHGGERGAVSGDNERQQLTTNNSPLTNNRQRSKGRVGAGEVQLTLFEMRDDKLREELKKIDLDTMTPMEAMQKLAELKKRV
ncbi:MAG: DNA mismatch repair protein MutS [Ignavibacteriae bacterium]|nr:DNA mismatch repair protein MutS [Ignavibacteriota bacterium]